MENFNYSPVSEDITAWMVDNDDYNLDLSEIEQIEREVNCELAEGN